MRLFCTVFEAGYLSKVADFNLPHMRLVPPYGVILFEFRHAVWRQKTIVCNPTFSRFDTVPECDRHTVTHTHTHTDRHTTTAYTAIAETGKLSLIMFRYVVFDVKPTYEQ